MQTPASIQIIQTLCVSNKQTSSSTEEYTNDEKVEVLVKIKYMAVKYFVMY